MIHVHLICIRLFINLKVRGPRSDRHGPLREGTQQPVPLPRPLQVPQRVDREDAVHHQAELGYPRLGLGAWLPLGQSAPRTGRIHHVYGGDNRGRPQLGRFS